MTEEQWDWRRAFSVTPNRAGKDHILMVRIVIWLCMWGLIIYGGLCLFGILNGNKQTPDVITADTANVDKSNKTVNETYLPLSNLFSFGSKGKVYSSEEK